MRELKFRAIKDDISNYNFVYGYLIKTPDGTPRITNDVGGLFHTCIKGTEGQFTGLKDKNGVDIYEGDMVYIAGYGLYECLFPFIELYEGSYENDVEDIKGNIHENPELLND